MHYLLAWIFSANIWLSPAAPSAVSAFYAECLDKKIQFNAHIWTKSKFLGMSIGVHNIGQGKPHSQRLDPPSSPEFQYVNDPPAAPAAGCVSCLEHDEHYILTFPNGYGRLVSPPCASVKPHFHVSPADPNCPWLSPPSRSILTVPWVELGGECNISCSKSGYSANIVFHTKPFYGGKKHRVTADIL